MKKLLIACIVILLILIVAVFGALWYVSPSETLDLNYKEVPLKERSLDMVRRLTPELVLTEDDVNQLGKAALSGQTEYQPGVVITGAKFRLAGDRLVADVNVKLKDRIPLGLTLTYRLEWKEPDLIARIEEAKLKDITISNKWFDDVFIPLGSYLPGLLKVDQIHIGDEKLTITFRKPTLPEMRKLLE
ncbi:hypothetical protein [Paenibacillus mendelii]|uniref:DUF2140 domain-containing protein n=1 Tax=Paenibacillus mendelii TaxID=206163 RepID=A0ABV6J5M4_9BACL|nr:hypothetical protein [Paenibacillus mendelii]MCQ6560113.1 hypothetical protein [Paenibacillus mendelii]